jgi:hypothetical protein
LPKRRAGPDTATKATFPAWSNVASLNISGDEMTRFASGDAILDECRPVTFQV